MATSGCAGQKEEQLLRKTQERALSASLLEVLSPACCLQTKSRELPGSCNLEPASTLRVFQSSVFVPRPTSRCAWSAARGLSCRCLLVSTLQHKYIQP